MFYSDKKNMIRSNSVTSDFFENGSRKLLYQTNGKSGPNGDHDGDGNSNSVDPDWKNLTLQEKKNYLESDMLNPDLESPTLGVFISGLFKEISVQKDKKSDPNGDHDGDGKANSEDSDWKNLTPQEKKVFEEFDEILSKDSNNRVKKFSPNGDHDGDGVLNKIDAQWNKLKPQSQQKYEILDQNPDSFQNLAVDAVNYLVNSVVDIDVSEEAANNKDNGLSIPPSYQMRDNTQYIPR